MNTERRLHICLGPTCNNNCLFCMEEDRESRAVKYSTLDSSAVAGILRQNEGRQEVMFTSGEPTLRPDLPKLLDLARSLGYRRIGLITNGRRLAYRSYVDTLVKSGLNHIIVSVHGHNSLIHDGLTRSPGSFANVVAGLANLRDARQGGADLHFGVSTVVNKRNMMHLSDILTHHWSFLPDELVFNTIQPMGRGATYFKQLIPKYTDVVGYYRAAWNVAQTLGAEVRLLDIPRCVTWDLPPLSVGFVEEHSHFEPVLGESPPPEQPADQVNGQKLAKGPTRSLDLVTKTGLDQMFRTWGPLCDNCDFQSRCDGIWKRYGEEFGFAEFQPIKFNSGENNND